jgi:predicted chitinase
LKGQGEMLKIITESQKLLQTWFTLPAWAMLMKVRVTGGKFRGRGIVQLTGKHNYEAFGNAIESTLDEVVEYLGTKMGALEERLLVLEQP